RYVPPSPLVLGRKPRKSPAPATDRDRPVSRRSKPSSRTAFIGEQPNPWELLHPQDAMSRHRGAKPPRRCERSAILLPAAAHQPRAWSFPPRSSRRREVQTVSSSQGDVAEGAWRAVVEGSWPKARGLPC